MLFTFSLALLFGAGVLLGTPAMAQDTTPPTLVKVEVYAATVTMTFNEPLDETSVPSMNAFRLNFWGYAWRGRIIVFPAEAAISGSAVMLTLHEPITGWPGLNVRYWWRPGRGSKLRDLDGNEVVEDTGVVRADNLTPPEPVVLRAETTADGSTVVVTFSEGLNQSAKPEDSTWTVTVDGTERPSSSAISGSEVRLFLASKVTQGQAVRVSYVKPDSSGLQDPSGNAVESFTDQVVRNTVGPPGVPMGVTVTPAAGSLSVSWTAPAGSALTDYDIRYYAGSADPSDDADWIEPGEPRGHDHTGTATTATIRGLTLGTVYRVQVRAVNGPSAGPWSESGSGSIDAPPADNHAPRLLYLDEDGTCKVWTDTSKLLSTTVLTPNVYSRSRRLTRRGSETTEFPTVCTQPAHPRYRGTLFIDDQDADPLTFTVGSTVPDNVVFLRGTPKIVDDNRVGLQAAAAFRDTDVRVEVTATDPHGESVSAFLVLELLAFGSTEAPRIDARVGTQGYRQGWAIAPLVLPTASGGDLGKYFASYGKIIEDRWVRWVYGNAFSHFYAVSGLPPGLDFDPETRTISGTPSASGTFTVTYTAEDADTDRSSGDTASLTFQMAVAESEGNFEGQVSGRSLSMTFEVELDPESRPSGQAFTATATPTDGSPRTIAGTDEARIAGRAVTVPLASAIAAGESVSVSYTRPSDGDVLRDTNGNEVPDFSDKQVVNEDAPAAVPTRFESAATVEQGRGLILTFTKEILLSGLHTDYTVLVDGERRETRHAFWPDNTVGLVLAEPVRWGETVTVAYAKPSDGVMLRDADELAIESFGPEAVANMVPRPENTPATGAPAIAGTAQVGETLAAETAAIADADGLSEATFAYQWLTNDGGADAEIAGATGASYTLTDADEGRTVKVRVTFTDDAGHAETLTSAATARVSGRLLTALTASFISVPTAHDGKSAFSFELRFNENFPGRLSYKVFKDQALQVTNGRATGVGRAAPGQNQRWRITVRPWSSEDMTVTLAATADCSASAAVCTPDGRALSNSPSVTVAGPGEDLPPPNSPATGAPTIAGTAKVGETLTASTAGIADADGLTGATFAYQWLSNDTDIAGATGASLTLADAQVGRTVKVRVAFTDDAGHAETLTSAATAAVASRPLTASFVGVPGEHDGRTAFSFELRFSDNFPGRLSYKVLKDQALQVTNGRAIGVKRAAPNQNQDWSITVRPWSVEDVTVTLAAGSVSTESGRTLSNTVAARVQGPPLLSVADAEAREGEDAAVEFAVTLSRAASGTVTVDFATADGTATAGEDYTATSGTMTFAVGETRKTVAVSILDDTHDEGQETFTLRLSNASGAAIRDGEATGTIANDDPMPKAWTARFGRSVAVHVVDAVEARLDEPSASWVQLGGQRLGGGPDVQETVQRLAPERNLWSEAEAAGRPGQHMTISDLLLGSAFHLVSNAGDEATGPRLSAWGRVATSGFDGREDKVSLDGTVTTATLGVDGVWKRWLTGLILAYSEGDGSFSHVDMPGGDLTSSLTSLHPYVAYTLSDSVRLWGLVGYGSGALRLDLEDRDVMDTDLTMSMGAVGMRGTLLQPSQPGGLELALRSDVLWMVMDSAAADNLAATEAEASRLRLVLEGSRPVNLAGGGSFTPSLEVGLRHDGGDAETGTGIEVGGSLRYASAWGLSIEASLRGLLAHEAQDYREWGASGALRFDPGRQGKGLTASIVPAWGSATSGVSRLWGRPGTPGLPGADPLAPAAAGRLDAEFGYGMATLQGRGLLTPYARVALTEGADQAWHLGTRLALAESLNFSLEASRRAREGEAAAHEVALLANLGF